jgi:hypothetical protein
MHRRQRLVAARRRQQRDVIAHRLVTVAPAKIENARAPVFGELRIRQVFAGGDYLGTGEFERPTSGVLDD